MPRFIFCAEKKLDIETFKTYCEARAKKTVFVFPTYPSSPRTFCSFFSIKHGHDLDAVAKQLRDAGYPTQALPIIEADRWTSPTTFTVETREQLMVQTALATLYQAVGAGLDLFLSLPPHPTVYFLKMGVDPSSLTADEIKNKLLGNNGVIEYAVFGEKRRFFYFNRKDNTLLEIHTPSPAFISMMNEKGLLQDKLEMLTLAKELQYVTAVTKQMYSTPTYFSGVLEHTIDQNPLVYNRNYSHSNQDLLHYYTFQLNQLRRFTYFLQTQATTPAQIEHFFENSPLDFSERELFKQAYYREATPFHMESQKIPVFACQTLYEKTCTKNPSWSIEKQFVEGAYALLNDYTKGNSRFRRILSGHWNRDHVPQVNQVLLAMGNREDITPKDILDYLYILLSLRPNHRHELSKRISFLERQYTALFASEPQPSTPFTRVR